MSKRKKKGQVLNIYLANMHYSTADYNFFSDEQKQPSVGQGEVAKKLEILGINCNNYKVQYSFAGIVTRIKKKQEFESAKKILKIK